MSARSYLAASGCVLLAGCGAPYQFSEAPQVPEAEVILGVKCEMARFLRERIKPPPGVPSFFSLDETQVAEIDLTLKTTRQSQGNIAGATVIPLGGATIAPWLSASYSTSSVITGTTQFVMEQAIKVKPVECAKAGKDDPAFGLGDWLLKKFEAEKAIPAGSPRVGLGKIVIATDFGVVWGGEAGTKATFAPVSVTPSISASRDDIQSLKITLRGSHVQQRYEFAKDGPTWKVAIPLANRAPLDPRFKQMLKKLLEQEKKDEGKNGSDKKD